MSQILNIHTNMLKPTSIRVFMNGMYSLGRMCISMYEYVCVYMQECVVYVYIYVYKCMYVV